MREQFITDDRMLIIEHLTLKELTRIFSKIAVNPLTQCWEWTGANDRGYGKTRYRGTQQKVHRLMYAWLVGPIPKGSGRTIPQLDHVVCDNPPCCNPAHVQPVLPKQNVLRSTKAPAAVNSRKTHCIHGHLLPEPEAGKRLCPACHAERGKTDHAHTRLEDWRKRNPNYMREWHKKHPGYARDYEAKRRAAKKALRS